MAQAAAVAEPPAPPRRRRDRPRHLARPRHRRGRPCANMSASHPWLAQWFAEYRNTGPGAVVTVPETGRN